MKYRAMALLALAASCGAIAFWGTLHRAGIQFFEPWGSETPRWIGYIGAGLLGWSALALEQCKQQRG